MVGVPNLGAQIKAARERSGKSPTVIAAMAQMSVANLYRIENEDTKAIPWETLKRLGDVLEVDFNGAVRESVKTILKPRWATVGSGWNHPQHAWV